MAAQRRCPGRAGYRVVAFRTCRATAFAPRAPASIGSVPGYRRFLASSSMPEDRHGDDCPHVARRPCRGLLRLRASRSGPRHRPVGSMGLVALGAEARAGSRRGPTTRPGRREGQARPRDLLSALVTRDFIDEEFRINNSAGSGNRLPRLGRYIGHKLATMSWAIGWPSLHPAADVAAVGARGQTVPLAVASRRRGCCPAAGWSCCTRPPTPPIYERAADFNACCAFLAGSSAATRRPREYPLMSDFIVNGTLIGWHGRGGRAAAAGSRSRRPHVEVVIGDADAARPCRRAQGPAGRCRHDGDAGIVDAHLPHQLTAWRAAWRSRISTPRRNTRHPRHVACRPGACARASRPICDPRWRLERGDRGARPPQGRHVRRFRASPQRRAISPATPALPTITRPGSVRRNPASAC